MKFNTYLLTLFALLFSFTSSGQGSWSSVKSYGGGARVAATAFSLNGNGFIMGGTDLSTEYGDCWRYRPDSNNWSKTASWPGGTSREPVSFTIGDYAYAGLGFVPGASKHIKAMYKYDITNEKWTAIASFPEGRRAASAFSIDSLGYVIGGFEYGYTPNRTVYAYSPSMNKWVRKKDYPTTIALRNYSVTLTVKGKAYLIGGYNQGSFYGDVYEYNAALDSWTAKADFPGNLRVTASGFVLNNKIYVGCGRDNSSTYIKDWYSYDPQTNKWTKEADYPISNSYGCVAFSLGTEAFVGTGNDGSSCTSKMYKFSFPEVNGVKTLRTQGPEVLVAQGSRTMIIKSTTPVNATIHLYDASGKLVWNTSTGLNTGKNAQELPELPCGIYFAEVLSNSCRSAVKFAVTE